MQSKTEGGGKGEIMCPIQRINDCLFVGDSGEFEESYAVQNALSIGHMVYTKAFLESALQTIERKRVKVPLKVLESVETAVHI